ncbi:MAG: hypothetical protein Kow0065_25370 [Methylomicrobium sp.]
MNHSEDTIRNYDHFLPQRNSLLMRGLLMTVTGFVLTVMSAVNPQVHIMSQASSWLPFVSIVIVIAGIMGCIDAYASRHSKEFYINLQIASMDTVVGIFLLTELNKPADKLILLAAAYLLIKGIFRVVAGISVDFVNHSSATWGGLLSIFFGLLLWQEWPSASMWFICFCLSVDVMTRGWALVRFGVWLRALHRQSNPEA